MTVKYYLLIDGIDGGSQARGHEGWFEINGYDLDLTHLASLAGGGSSAGDLTEFSPLLVDLGLGEGLTDLLAAAAAGDHFRGIQIEGVIQGDSPHTVFDLTLGNVQISKLAEGSGVNDTLAFSYDKIWVETTGQSPTGTSDPTESFGFDLTTNTDIGTAGKPSLHPGNDAETGGQPTQYFLLIDGIDGGSQARGHEGWFEINGYDLDLTHLASLAGGGSSAGDLTEFSPLLVDLGLGEGLTDLLAAAAAGDHFRGIQIEGVIQGDSPHTVFDLTLGNVQISKLAEGSGVNDTLAFSYDKIWVETTGQSPTGTSDPTESFGFDLTTNTDIGTAGKPSLHPGNDAETGGQPTQYFLLIDGIDGGSQARGHEGWFEINGYDLDLTHLASLAGGGSSAGDLTEFSPLLVDLGLGEGLTDLLAAAAAGDHFRGIQIEGVIQGDSPHTVFDLTLGNVQISKLAEGSGVNDTLAFSYDKIWVETTGQSPTGTSDPTESFGFDLTTNTDIGTAGKPSLHPGNDAETGGQPTQYFLLIDGIDGGSQARGHEGWFEINGYDLDLTHLASLAGGGSSAGDLTEFSPLLVDLGLGEGLTDLLAAAAAGDHFRGIQIEGVIQGDSPHTVFDLTLGNVQISKLAEGSGVNDTLAFSYDKIWVETTGQSPTGTSDPTESFGFDLTTNTDIGTAGKPSLHPGNDAETGGQPTQYFLLIDGIDGGSQARGHEGWFEINGYDLDLTHLASLAGGGSSAGDLTEFSPLLVDLGLGEGLTDLLAAAAAGDHFRGIQIEGVIQGDSPHTVFDLTLGNVQISKLAEGSGVNDTLAFSYDKIWVETTGQSPTGTSDPTESFGFDLTTNTDIGTAGKPSLHPGNDAETGGQPTQYFLLIDGIDGGSQARGHEGWFEINGYDLDLTHLASLAGGGSSAGDLTEFSPLLVDLGLGEGLIDLLAAAAAGDHFRGIQIEGVIQGDSPHTVFDLTLGNVQISKLAEGSGVNDTLAFSYDKIWVETTGQSPTGTSDPTESFGFDLTTNTDIGTAGKPSLNNPAQDHDPVAQDDGGVAQANGILSVAEPGVLENDTDVDGDALAVVVVEDQGVSVPILGAYGTLTLNANGSYEYAASDLQSAPLGQHAHDLFDYTVGDGYGGSDVGTLDIFLNRAPSVAMDVAGVQVGKQLSATAATGVLSNDLDHDADSLSVSAIVGGSLGSPVQGQFGALTLNNDGSYSYVAKSKLGSEDVGWDLFTYKVSDGHGGSLTSSLLVTVLGSGQSYVAGTSGDDPLLMAGAKGNGKSVIVGAEGNDNLKGGNAGDFLFGGPGNDVLSGGNGPDVFLFDHLSTGRSLITDFKLKVDRLELINVAIADVESANGSTTVELSNGGVVVLSGVSHADALGLLS